MTNRIATATLAALMAGAAFLGGCGDQGQSASADGGGKYAGLDDAIRGWRDDIRATEAACQEKSKDKTCQAFEVSCKGERTIGAQEQAEGVQAKVVVAMQWQGWNAAKGEFQASPEFAEFTKVGDAWRRQEATRVNLSTCA